MALATPAKGVRPLCPACLLDFALDEASATGEPMGNDATEQPSVGTSAPVDGQFAHYALARRDDGHFVELGRGGMGVTYRATDEILHYDVALKVVNPGFVQDARVRARFLREAQVAAGLRHPHVASVFFFGEHAGDGQLFYAMELVEGETLHTRVRRSGGLPADTVLAIGSQVTDALAAAEARGLTHRDLKPANLMLVEGEAVNVKVIDFGLAKILSEEFAEDAALTRTQEFVGTPAFASPEQGNVWQETDARSDFYALGATLWYALTGHVPFAGRTAGEIHERQLAGALPLDQLRAARVPRPLADLLRALLSPDPAGRPQTARELAVALANCRQAPQRQRTRRLAVAAGSVFALWLGWWAWSHHATISLTRQNAQLQSQASAQQRQLDALQAQLHQQTQLITLVNAKIDRHAAEDTTALAAAQVEAAHERGIDVGTLQKQLAGEQADVRALLIKIDGRLAAAQTQVEQWRQLKRTTLLRLGEGEFAAGHYAVAVEPYQQALALFDAEKEPLAWCDAADRLAFALVEAARYAEAAPLLHQIIDRRTARQGPEHLDTLKAMRVQAKLFDEQGNRAQSEAIYRRVLEAQERTLGRDDRETLKTLSGLASLPARRGNHAESEALDRRCLEACERTLGPDDLLTLASTNNLAVTLYDEGRYAEAVSLDRRALEAYERQLGSDHPRTLRTANNLANALQHQGDLAGAEALFRRALAAQERTLGPEHPETLRSVYNLALVLTDKGDLAGAEPFSRRALDIRERTLGSDHPETLSSLSELAQLLDAEGNFATAEPLYLRAQASMERLLPPGNDVRLDLEHYFSLFREKQGRLSEALALAAQVAAGCKGMPERSAARRAYEQHYQDLQAKAR